MKTIFPGKYGGKVVVPPSKSDSQRALLAAGLASGTSVLKNVGNSKDEAVMLRFIRQIGAVADDSQPGTLLIKGTREFPRKMSINLGESGLSSRLIIALCSAFGGDFEFTGEGSLLKRPMHFFEEYLPQFGVRIQSEKGYLPMRMDGHLSATELEVDASEGSQYLSGLLMALPLVEGKSVLNVKNLVSKPYVEMTLRTLAAFGIMVQHRELQLVEITGKQEYSPSHYKVESDWSSASYWLVAATLGQDITLVGLQKDSAQADKRLLDLLQKSACIISWNENGLHVDGSSRKAFTFDATDCPDLFPALCTLAALTPGISEIIGVNRLATKESNRGLALQSEFAKLGVPIEINGDHMHISGQAVLEGGVQVDAHNDHRIAMCLAIAGMFSKKPLVLSGEDAVQKSYPGFWKDFDGLLVNR